MKTTKSILALKISAYIPLPKDDIAAAAKILNAMVAAQDSGDYTEVLQMATIEGVKAEQVRRAFEVVETEAEPALPLEEPADVAVTPIGVDAEPPTAGPADEGDDIPDSVKRLHGVRKTAAA